MSAKVKFLIGLVAALVVGWVAYGPLGQGAAFIDRVEAQARAVVRDAAVPGVEVRIARDPLRRDALLSGPANDFQREGQGLYPGLNDRVLAVPGVGGIAWADRGRASGGSLIRLPLIVEVELLVIGLFGLGVAIGRLLFRPRREHFL